jgi:D-alanine-D-alanine ligase
MFFTLKRLMRIALTYNVKREQTMTNESGDSLDPSSILPGYTSAEPSPKYYDDTYAEWDSWETVHALRDAIATRHAVTMIEANEDAFETLRTSRPDFVFNIAEGFNGVSREAQIPAMCEMLQLPYLGSDPLTLSLCLDKARTKEVLTYHNIPNASFFVCDDAASLNGRTLTYPQIVKPLHEGSSKGIYNSSLVRSYGELADEIQRISGRYGQPALVESFLPGREFTVALLGNGGNVRALPIVEIKYEALPHGVNPIYSFEAKWIWDTRDQPLEIFSCPARIEPALQRAIEKICIETYGILRCRDWSRVDVRLDDNGIPHIIEINPLPGILPNEEDNSCFPKAARAAGMSYQDLILGVIELSKQRWGIA